MDSRVSELELKVLSDIVKIIGNALNLDGTLEEILRIVSEYLSMKRATITHKPRDSDRLLIRASHGMTQQEKSRGVSRIDESMTGRIFLTAKPFVAPDIGNEPIFLDKKRSPRTIEKGRVAYIGVPIILHGRPVGVLSVDRLFDEDVSFEEDIRFLTILAALTGRLISLNDQVEERERNLLKANLSLKEELSDKCRSFFHVGYSPAMTDARKLIRKVAPTSATVLLLGESGTGKTLVAQIIHELSGRRAAAFIKVNTAALPDNLLESELFGYEKGAFTGATESKPGRVEEAEGGSIFLDEIGELSLPLQTKLLRFLQDKEFERLGGTKTHKVDVRIVAATNKDLDRAVHDGLFREDLFYRLNVFPIRIPPLRERREDLAELVGYFSEKLCRQYGCDLTFAREAMNALITHDWPGNVREMENLIERLAIMWEGGPITLEHLAPYLSNQPIAVKTRHPTAGEPRRVDSLKEMEKTRVIEALQRNNWIQARAAHELGITLRQMGYRVKKYGLGQLIKSAKSEER